MRRVEAAKHEGSRWEEKGSVRRARERQRVVQLIKLHGMYVWWCTTAAARCCCCCCTAAACRSQQSNCFAALSLVHHTKPPLLLPAAAAADHSPAAAAAAAAAAFSAFRCCCWLRINSLCHFLLHSPSSRGCDRSGPFVGHACFLCRFDWPLLTLECLCPHFQLGKENEMSACVC